MAGSTEYLKYISHQAFSVILIEKLIILSGIKDYYQQINKMTIFSEFWPVKFVRFGHLVCKKHNTNKRKYLLCT
jgi:hypothetical protein